MSAGIICPECSGPTRCFNSRPVAFGRYRRRECTHCGHRFSTHEVVCEDTTSYAAGYFAGRESVLRQLKDVINGAESAERVRVVPPQVIDMNRKERA